MLRKFILAVTAILALSSTAQDFSEMVSLVGVQGDNAIVEAIAVGSNKDKAYDNAVASAFNAVINGGLEGLKSGTPMVSDLRPDYKYRFFKESRFNNYIVGPVEKISVKKVNNNQQATVRVTISLKGLKKEFERNNIALNPTWQDTKAVKATVSLNPSIVVVPTVKGENNDFEAMRDVVDSSNTMKYIVNAVAAEFSKRGYKTRDFTSMLGNSKTDDLLTGGTQTDARTMVAQQLPGDIVVYVDPTVTCNGRQGSCAIALKAVEKQTAGNLATASFSSGQYMVTDSLKLADYALSKVADDFFNTLSSAFETMVSKGREVVIDFTLSESVNDWDFDQDSPSSGNYFKDALEEWLRDSSHQGVYEMGTSTDKYIHASLNVPLWNYEKNRSYSLSNFGSDLRRFLKEELGNDYKANITSLGQKISVTIE